MNVSLSLRAVLVFASLSLMLPGATWPASAIADEPAAPAPYGIDSRPAPGNDATATLLPETVGDFKRGSEKEITKKGSELQTEYVSGSDKIFVTAASFPDLYEAQDEVESMRDVVLAGRRGRIKVPLQRMREDPSFFRVAEEGVAYMAWSRGHYVFTAHAGASEELLDRFMKAFPF